MKDMIAEFVLIALPLAGLYLGAALAVVLF